MTTATNSKVGRSYPRESAGLIINRGSVDDIKASLKICASTMTLAEVQKNIDAEMAGKNRKSVLLMLYPIKNALKKGGR